MIFGHDGRTDWRFQPAPCLREVVVSAPSKVLIVEDNPLNMKMFAALIANRGHDVLEASDGLAGLDLAHEAHPHLIIMDLDLPGISGLAATRALKSDHRTRDIPVLLTTAIAGAEDDPCVRDCGCDGFLPKPISVASFLATVEAFLTLAGQAG
jgi:two-component system cell cycle response regulator DivK